MEDRNFRTLEAAELCPAGCSSLSSKLATAALSRAGDKNHLALDRQDTPAPEKSRASPDADCHREGKTLGLRSGTETVPFD